MTAARAMPLTGISNALGHAVFAIRHEGVRAATHPLCMSPNVGSDETCCVCPRLRERERVRDQATSSPPADQKALCEILTLYRQLKHALTRCLTESGRRDSNPRPSPWQREENRPPGPPRPLTWCPVRHSPVQSAQSAQSVYGLPSHYRWRRHMTVRSPRRRERIGRSGPPRLPSPAEQPLPHGATEVHRRRPPRSG